MPIWPTHPKSQKGELLSSWLVRIAAEWGKTVTAFCSNALLLRKTNLRRLDYAASDSVLRLLSEGTGTPIERVRETLIIFEDSSYTLQVDARSVHWLTPFLSARDVTAWYAIGMAYCPECLRTDEKPFYRKNWRNIFQTICPTHRIPLRKSCPHCNKPYGHTILSETCSDIFQPVATCWSCRKKVWPNEPSKEWDGNVVNLTLPIQEKILATTSKGLIDVPGYGDMNSHRCKEILYKLIQSFQNPSIGEDNIRLAIKMSGIEVMRYWPESISPLHAGCQDFMQPEVRAIYLCLANWLMGEWPTRLMTYAEKSELSHKKLFGFEPATLLGFSQIWNIKERHVEAVMWKKRQAHHEA